MKQSMTSFTLSLLGTLAVFAALNLVGGWLLDRCTKASPPKVAPVQPSTYLLGEKDCRSWVKKVDNTITLQPGYAVNHYIERGRYSFGRELSVIIDGRGMYTFPVRPYYHTAIAAFLEGDRVAPVKALIVDGQAVYIEREIGGVVTDCVVYSSAFKE